MADGASAIQGHLVLPAAGAHRLPQVLDHQRPQPAREAAHCGDPEGRRRGQEGRQAVHHRWALGAALACALTHCNTLTASPHLPDSSHNASWLCQMLGSAEGATIALFILELLRGF